MALNAIVNGGIGALGGKLGGAGAQYGKYNTNYVTSILFDGNNILGTSTKRVWSEYGKYYTDSIAKAIVKGFGFGSIPSTAMTTWQMMENKEEDDSCIN